MPFLVFEFFFYFLFGFDLHCVFYWFQFMSLLSLSSASGVFGQPGGIFTVE